MKTMLLDVCCGPCATQVIHELLKEYRVSLIFPNSNIYPRQEYEKRLMNAKKVAGWKGLQLITLPYLHNEWLEIIKPYIKELHLHDNLRHADDHLAVGDGDFDFAALFRELQGIDCVYTVEAHNIKDAMTGLQRLAGYF